MASNKNQPQKKTFKFSNEVKELLKLNFKKYKKNNNDYGMSKKELKKMYYAEIVDRLPDTIAMLIKFGNVPEVKEVKEEIYAKIVDPDFVDYMKKEIKKYDLEFDNMMLFPVVVWDIQEEYQKALKKMQEENPDAKLESIDDVTDLSKLILKKKIKKLEKAGFDEALAFDVLSVVPHNKILEKGAPFHLRRLFHVLYEHANTKDIDFEKLMNVMFKDNEEDIATVLTFALLEKKEKLTTMSEGQKKLFNNITEYVFKTLEDMSKTTIMSVMKSYCESRKRDEAAGRDANRRYYISSLPESDYPRIMKVVEKLSENETYKKYF